MICKVMLKFLGFILSILFGFNNALEVGRLKDFPVRLSYGQLAKSMVGYEVGTVQYSCEIIQNYTLISLISLHIGRPSISYTGYSYLPLQVMQPSHVTVKLLQKPTYLVFHFRAHL